MAKRKNNNKKVSNKQRKREKQNHAKTALATQHDVTGYSAQTAEREQKDDVQPTYTLVDRRNPVAEINAIGVAERAAPEVLATRRILPLVRRLPKRKASLNSGDGGLSSAAVQPKKARKENRPAASFWKHGVELLHQHNYDYASYYESSSRTRGTAEQEEDLRNFAQFKNETPTETPRAKALLDVIREKKGYVAAPGEHTAAPCTVQPPREALLSQPYVLLGLPNTTRRSLRRERRQEEKLVALHVPPLEHPYFGAAKDETDTGAQKSAEHQGVSPHTSYTPCVENLANNTGAAKGAWCAGVDSATNYAGDVMLFPTVDCVHKGFHLDDIIIAQCDKPVDFVNRNARADEESGIPHHPTAPDAAQLPAHSKKPVTSKKLKVTKSEPPAPPPPPPETRLWSKVASTIEPEVTAPSRKTVRFALSPSKTSEEFPFLPKVKPAPDQIGSAQPEIPVPDAPPPHQQSVAAPACTSSSVRDAFQANNIPSNLGELELLAEFLAKGLNMTPAPSFLDMRGGLLRGAEEYGTMQ